MSYILQCSIAVALGGYVQVAAALSGSGPWLRCNIRGSFPRRLASLIILAGPSGPAFFWHITVLLTGITLAKTR